MTDHQLTVDVPDALIDRHGSAGAAVAAAVEAYAAVVPPVGEPLVTTRVGPEPGDVIGGEGR